MADGALELTRLGSPGSSPSPDVRAVAQDPGFRLPSWLTLWAVTLPVLSSEKVAKLQAEVGTMLAASFSLLYTPLHSASPGTNRDRFLADGNKVMWVFTPALSPTYRAVVPLTEPWTSHLYTGCTSRAACGSQDPARSGKAAVQSWNAGMGVGTRGGALAWMS